MGIPLAGLLDWGAGSEASEDSMQEGTVMVRGPHSQMTMPKITLLISTHEKQSPQIRSSMSQEAVHPVYTQGRYLMEGKALHLPVAEGLKSDVLRAKVLNYAPLGHCWAQGCF